MECDICFEKKIYFFKCPECKNPVCYHCFKKVDLCPFCRYIYTNQITLLKYIINIKRYYKNYNKNKSLKKRKRKMGRLKKIKSMLR
jgi:hypothetical protein